MSISNFVHLRGYSSYSLLYGAIRFDELIAKCKKLNMPAVAITDKNNMFGSFEFARAASNAGLQLITAIDIAIDFGDEDDRNHPNPPSVALLVKDEQGYLNLLKLQSEFYAYAPEQLTARAIGIDQLRDASQGLICLSGGHNGAIERALQMQRPKMAESRADILQDIFGDRLYFELQRQGLREQDATENGLLDLALAKDIGVVATNHCCFLEEHSYEAHDALLCIGEGRYVSETDRPRSQPAFYFRTDKEMEDLFDDIPEAIANSLVIAKRCAYVPQFRQPLLPTYTKLEAGKNETDTLRELSIAGLKARLEATNGKFEDYAARIDYELDMIERTGFAGYFLIVADFIQWARKHGIPVGPGRGSGAGSVVAWALTITGVDPLQFGLLFERFLNPERVSMPDFDVDFCQDRRDEVISYVQNEYGADRVAQIITHGSLQPRAVLRDVGRVLQMPHMEIDKLCKMVPNNPAAPVTLEGAIKAEPQISQRRDDDPNVAKLLDIGMQLEGLYRHASTHAAGVVVGDRPLHELIPLYRDARSVMAVTQFNMKYVEQAGLVKLDLLGLKTLSVIQMACDLIEQIGPSSVDIDMIALDDDDTFAMLCKAESVGVFQLESAGMRDVLRKLRPDRFDDLIAVVALYRPGPMENIPAYIRRKHGEENVEYLHKTLEVVLGDTYGIAIYQEQVMQMAQLLAGYTLGGADLLRRAMGKKIQSEMDAQRQVFVDGAKKTQGIDKSLANRIFDEIARFAGYGFNKCHATPYALLSYQTAWLKANHSVAFYAATLTYDQQNTDRLSAIYQAMLSHGIGLLPPDINSSHARFTPQQLDDQPLAVRYGLGAIKNLGSNAIAVIEAVRAQDGPFVDMYDFISRVDAKVINRRFLEALIMAGAFDGLNDNRRQLYESVDTLLQHGQLIHSERASQQVSMFGADTIEDHNTIPLAPIQDWSSLDRLNNEQRAIGFYLSAHPLDGVAMQTGLDLMTLAEISNPEVRLDAGADVLIIITARRILRTRTGKRMAILMVSDPQMMREVVVFDETFEQYREVLTSDKPIVARLSRQDRASGDEMRLTVSRCGLLSEISTDAKPDLLVSIRDQLGLAGLQGILAEHTGKGDNRVLLQLLDRAEGAITMQVATDVRITPNLLMAVKSLKGIIDAEFQMSGN